MCGSINASCRCTAAWYLGRSLERCISMTSGIQGEPREEVNDKEVSLRSVCLLA